MAKSFEKLKIPGADSVTVALRMRALLHHELGQRVCLSMAGQQIDVLHDQLDKAVEDQFAGEGPFQFDVAMDSSDQSSKNFIDNRKCYELIGKPLVQDALRGSSVCLMCYGEIGSGKTATMIGCPELGQGLLPRILGDMCAEAANLRKYGFKVSMTIQMLEVYKDGINDLLVDRSHWDDVGIKARTLPTKVVVQGATERLVRTVDECNKVVDEGMQRKTVASIPDSAHSSRGHTVLKLTFDKAGKTERYENAKKMTSEICFVDLAGHENSKTTAATGERLEELSHINTSLMYLKRAISELGKMANTGKTHKDQLTGAFRNSKLTQLLANSVTSPGSKTYIVIALSPASLHFEATYRSLEFATEVKGNAKLKPLVPITSLQALENNDKVQEKDENKDKEWQLQIENLQKEIAQLRDDNAFLTDENTRLKNQPKPQSRGCCGCCQKRADRKSDDMKRTETE
mmetsp:Transcript_129496/g.252136  ORF Transcript_129496/g.252136 Transcript_129496/m.252136 type:complete len:459 (-) Transcript_129496:201-1577(-)|eukprot:CAMPEP_0172811156 /NCGR_PEP_ID=MMETSP1075-20121228/9242_1 /TAXON_ID=2916 /ORGANISM="Ceratium fusus, Strain PA161109" /LENGTH=458 /DNA_ID=CAMNT_0013650551 /DNA_START=49 /DNA_END=1425 /DNA_ORIENTATION=+